MSSLFSKLKELNLRIDLATSQPQQIESDEFIVHSKLEVLDVDADGRLVPKAKITVSGLDNNPKIATSKSLEKVEEVFGNAFLSGLLAQGIGYEIAASQPFYQKSEEFLVVGKLELFDFDDYKKPRTLNKVSFNVFNESPIVAQEEALKLVLDVTEKLK